MGWFENDDNKQCFDQVKQNGLPDTPPDSDDEFHKTHGIAAGAAATLLFHEYEEHEDKKNGTPSHSGFKRFAEEAGVFAVGYEGTKIAEEDIPKWMNKEKLTKERNDRAMDMFDNHYGTEDSPNYDAGRATRREDLYGGGGGRSGGYGGDQSGYGGDQGGYGGNSGGNQGGYGGNQGGYDNNNY